MRIRHKYIDFWTMEYGPGFHGHCENGRADQEDKDADAHYSLGGVIVFRGQE